MAEQQGAVFHSSRTDNGWVVTDGGEILSRHSRQKEAEAAAAEAARNAQKKGGIAHAVLHRRDGSVRQERSYGRRKRQTRQVEQLPPDFDQQIHRAIEQTSTEWAKTFELRIVGESWRDGLNDDVPHTITADGDAFAFPEAIGECREIGAVPPIGAPFNDPEMHARIGAALAKRFPQFTWRVAEWPLRDDTFSLIPMLGSVKAGGLLKPPDPALLELITNFLNETFAPNRKMH